MREFRTILPFLKQNKWSYIVGLIALCVVDIANLYVPQVLKAFGDKAQYGELNLQVILRLALMIIALGIIVAVGRFGWRMNIFGTARKLEYWIRAKLFQKYLQLDDNFYHQQRVGDLMAHVTNDVLMVRNSMGGGIIMIFDAVFMTLFTVFMMVSTVGLKTSLVALLALPFLALTVSTMAKPLRNRSREVQDTFSELTNEVQENISGIHNIKAFSIEQNRTDVFAEVNEKYQEKNISLLKLSSFFDPLITFISGIAFAVFIIYGIRSIRQNEITLGDFIAVIQYVRMMVWPMVALGMVVNRFQRGIASITRINEILAQESDIKESDNPISIPLDKVKVEFRNVSFRYSEKEPYILENVSFVVEDQKSLAILGKTGSGKSTILSLIMRRFDVTSGAILINDVDIRDISFADLYGAISLVEQESFLFSRTIARNIAFSTEDTFDPDEVKESAVFSQVDKDIMDMPEQYETWVGERGVTLSGGQKQRVSIARAHYQKTRMLMLDDALSAVDTNTEHHILNHLKEFNQGLIVVSQRVSTVKNMDEILVIDEGHVIQRGTHEELLSQSGGFYDVLYHRQLLESELKEDGLSADEDLRADATKDLQAGTLEDSKTNTEGSVE